MPLFARAAWLLPDMVDEPLRQHDLNLKWVVEGWVAGVFGGQDAFEGGVRLGSYARASRSHKVVCIILIASSFKIQIGPRLWPLILKTFNGHRV